MATSASKALKANEFFIIVNHNMREKMQSCSISTTITSILGKILNLDIWSLITIHHDSYSIIFFPS
jgi:hypothetical protein